MSDGVYSIDISDVIDEVCDCCPCIKLTYRSRFPEVHDGPDEYDCPLGGEPNLIYDENELELRCKYRESHESRE